MSIDYNTEVSTIDGQHKDLSEYKGQFLLVVNVASQCGLTPQYGGLQKLYERLQDHGFVVLGFPCNQFGQQEPGADSEIQLFCETHFGVSFPMFSKVKVNGPNTHPLWRQLKSQAPGLMGSRTVKWNFTKFLVSPEGEVMKRYSPQTSAEQILNELQELLDEPQS
ncbi:MAG: glutathione peroxidase [Myxococcales bacterium]|nr:glutathione peroxidase [Myxococcales bacterium]